MAKKKKSTAVYHHVSADEAGREFGISLLQLKTLMETRGQEGIRELNETYGGIDGLGQRLKTNLITGLSNDETDLAIRITAFGRNEIPRKSPKTFLRLVFDALKDRTLVILIILGIISLTSSIYHPSKKTYETKIKQKRINVEWIEGAIIIVAVLVVVLVIAFKNWLRERRFYDSQSKIELDQKFNVIRDNIIRQIPIKDIVVGDICQIKSGDLLPVDGIVVQSNELKVDESSLTGEPDLIRKHESRDPFLLTGTQIMEGSGSMLVLVVGEHSQTGMIFKLLGTTTEESSGKNMNFENKNQKSGSSAFYIPHTHEWSYKYWSGVLRYVITFIIIYVFVVPKCLLLIVTQSLEYAVKKIMKDNIILRHLDACETMGYVTSICCDKTGVLTTNRMTVVQVYVGEKHWKNVANSVKTEKMTIPVNTKEIIVEGISVNTSYSSKLLLPSEKEILSKHIGNKTECGLLDFVGVLDGNYDEIRTYYPEDRFIHIYPFNSIRKNMSTIIRRSNSTIRMYTKGASEIVLKKCKTILNQNGDIVPFSSVDYDRLIQTVIEPMASDGLRTICLAYRDFSLDRLPDWDDETSIIDQLTCICICGIEDPIRLEVPDTIAKCRNAGIIVRMFTGDNVNTAQSIAIKCGIIKPNDSFLVLEGEEYNRRIKSELDEKVEQNLLDKVWPHLRVLARASPQDKYELVKGIIASKINPIGEVVAVIGDGTNDGPALKRADVGCVMGREGTDVAKEASDIILVDDNLNSIVKIIMWGRYVYHSVAKSLQFQLTVNIVIVLCAFIGACIVKESPLRGIQILWIYLTMNILATLAFAFEMPTEELLTHKPYGRTPPLISRIMMKNIIGHAIYQLAVMFFILFVGPKVFYIDDGRPNGSIFKPSEHFTMIFNVFVLMTLFNEINCRKIHGEKNVFREISKTPLFYGIWIVTFVLQVALVQYGSVIFFCVRLTFKQWMWCLIFGVTVLLWNQILNLIPVSCHTSKRDGRDVYELTSSVDLDPEEQSRRRVSLTKEQTL
ncbi:unnamed protein product [Rotaria sp. Silwood1]|nr:unnamed protein product [Rotaria sp. Silwood1]